MSDVEMERSAVNTLNVLIILMLVGLTLFWLASSMAQLSPVIIIYGVNPYFWPTSFLGAAVASAINIPLSLLHLLGVSLIVNRNTNAPILIQLFCVLMIAGGLFESKSILDAVFTVPVYLVLVVLIGIVRRNFKR